MGNPPWGDNLREFCEAVAGASITTSWTPIWGRNWTRMCDALGVPHAADTQTIYATAVALYGSHEAACAAAKLLRDDYEGK